MKIKTHLKAGTASSDDTTLCKPSYDRGYNTGYNDGFDHGRAVGSPY
jgi:hypothetical protein